MLNINELSGFGALAVNLTHRWWRVRFTAPFYDGYDYYPDFAAVREVEMRLVPGGVDQTQLPGYVPVGGIYISSSDGAGGPAYGAYDEVLSWSSGQHWTSGTVTAGGQWIGWVFDDAKPIAEMALDFGGYGVASLVIEYSDDGSNWFIASTHTGPAALETGWKTYLCFN